MVLLIVDNKISKGFHYIQYERLGELIYEKFKQFASSSLSPFILSIIHQIIFLYFVHSTKIYKYSE